MWISRYETTGVLRRSPGPGFQVRAGNRGDLQEASPWGAQSSCINPGHWFHSARHEQADTDHTLQRRAVCDAVQFLRVFALPVFKKKGRPAEASHGHGFLKTIDSLPDPLSRVSTFQNSCGIKTRPSTHTKTKTKKKKTQKKTKTKKKKTKSEAELHSARQPVSGEQRRPYSHRPSRVAGGAGALRRVPCYGLGPCQAALRHACHIPGRLSLL